MKKHRKAEPEATAIGFSAKKILPLGAMLAVLAWPVPAPGQTLAEPPPVESFALGSGQSGGADDDTALEDFYLQAGEGLNVPAVTPRTGGAPLPPGTPLHTPAAKQTAAENSSVSGTFSLPVGSGAGVAAPEQSSDAAAQGSSTSSVSSPLSPPPNSGGSSFAPASSETGPAGSASVPLGQGAALPQPDWQEVYSPEQQPRPQYYSDAPEPQFDAGQSRWIQPEVGQSVGLGPAPAAPQARPTSVPTVHTSPSEKLDAVVDGLAQAPADQERPATQSQAVGGIRTPEGRERIRHLFSDIMSSDSLEAPASPSGSEAPPVPDFTGLNAKSSPSPDARPGPVEDYDGSSAILKAGGLLSLEGHYGGAEVLPPLTGQPPLKTPPPPVNPASKPPEAREPQPAKAAPPAAVAAPAAAKQPGKAKASGSKRASSKAATVAAPSGAGLMIINETGNPRVGDIYKSVLSRTGHKVISVAEGAPAGTPGQTVINYRPGYRAQAQSVSRHLPGKKVLSEAKSGQVLASEVMVYIR